MRGEMRVIVPNWRELAEAPPGRRKGGGKVNVRALVFPPELEILVNVIKNLVA